MSGPRRFVELQRVLPGISTEQLRSRLNRMVADGMLTRKRYREVPPRVDYELTDRARELVGVLGELARWGYEWAWSPPRPSESIDIGAIFRVIPGLVSPGSVSPGRVELVVTDGRGGEPASYLVFVDEDSIEVSERDERPAEARVSGSVAAWVAALSPLGDTAGLRFTGERRAAEELLAAFGPAAARVGEAADVAAGGTGS